MRNTTGNLICIITAMAICLILIGGCKKKDDVSNTPTTVVDKDGNVYHTVTIGTQVWMKENLKTTKYRNGDAIPFVNDTGTWLHLNTGAYCKYIPSDSNEADYGYLYNWFAASDARKITPAGWHIPSQAEFETLIDFLGGKDIAGGKIKEVGTNHWVSPNYAATNESGFTALPAGGLSQYGEFADKGLYATWWSTTECSGTTSMFAPSVSTYWPTFRSNSACEITQGVSIRCIKD